MEAVNKLLPFRQDATHILNTQTPGIYVQSCLIGCYSTKIRVLIQKAINTYKHVPRKLYLVRPQLLSSAPFSKFQNGYH